MSTKQFTAHLVTYALHAGDMQAMRLQLLEQAPKMKAAEKIEADKAVVQALAKKYGIEATPVQKGGKFSKLTFDKRGGDDAWVRACNCANVALSRARAILQGKVKAKANESAAQRAFNVLSAKLDAGDEEAKALVKALFLSIKGKGAK